MNSYQELVDDDLMAYRDTLSMRTVLDLQIIRLLRKLIYDINKKSDNAKNDK